LRTRLSGFRSPARFVLLETEDRVGVDPRIDVTIRHHHHQNTEKSIVRRRAFFEIM
jgi:hypothetical protein